MKLNMPLISTPIRALKSRIALKIILIQLLGVGLPLSLLGTHLYKLQSKDLELKFSISVMNIEESIKSGLQKPLWNFSPGDSKPFLKTLVSRPEVDAVYVYESDEKLFIETQKPDWNQSSSFKKSINVFNEGQYLGKVDLYLNKESLKKQQKRNLTEIVFFISITIFVVLSATFLLIRQSLLKKVYRLRKQFLKLQKKELGQAFKWDDGDEINTLGKSLESARQTLEVLIKDLQDSNSNLEQQVTERSQNLINSSRLASLGEMAGGIAHEINNPLTIIGGKVHRIRRVIQAEAQVPEALKQSLSPDLEVIDQTIDRISKIIKGLRSFSRDGTADPLETYPIHKLIMETLDLCRIRFQQHGVKLEYNSQIETLEIRCRPVQIGQVILNLLNNSFDAVEPLSDKWVSIDLLQEGANVEIIVTDSGQGIEKKISEKIMQPFFTTKEIGKGTGLGLSISQGIIKSHRGSLELNTQSANTQFICKLPINPEVLQ